MVLSSLHYPSVVRFNPHIGSSSPTQPPDPRRSVAEVDCAIIDIVNDVNLEGCNLKYGQANFNASQTPLDDQYYLPKHTRENSLPPLPEWTTPLNDEYELMEELDALGQSPELEYPTQFETSIAYSGSLPKYSSEELDPYKDIFEDWILLQPEHIQEQSPQKEAIAPNTETTKKRNREESLSTTKKDPPSIAKKRKSISLWRGEKNLKLIEFAFQQIDEDGHINWNEVAELLDINKTQCIKQFNNLCHSNNPTIRALIFTIRDIVQAINLYKCKSTANHEPIGFSISETPPDDPSKLTEKLCQSGQGSKGCAANEKEIVSEATNATRKRKKERLVANTKKVPIKKTRIKHSGWNDVNDLKLIELAFKYKKSGRIHWNKVIEELGNNKTPEQSKAEYLRLYNCRNSNPTIEAQFNKFPKSTSNWDEVIDLKLIELVSKHTENGRTHWKRVTKKIGNNTNRNQCYERYQLLETSRKNNPVIDAQFNKFPKSKNSWDLPTNLKLIELVFKYKKNSQTDWKKVVEELGNQRTSGQCNAQYLRLEKNRKKNPAIDAQFNLYPRSIPNWPQSNWRNSEWGPSNNLKLIKLAFKHLKNGKKDWITVAKLLNINKTARQCFKHFGGLSKSNNPIIKAQFEKCQKKFSQT